MSIRDVLVARVQEGAIVEIKPLLPIRTSQSRSVWVGKDVNAQLSPSTADDEYALAAGRLRRRLELVAGGSRVVVGDRKVKTCDVKRLDPKESEVWEIRINDDNPNIRVFFRFIEKDCFFATNMRLVSDLFSMNWRRHGMDFWPIWRIEIRRCKRNWRNFFMNYPPHKGDKLDDYLTNAIEAGTF